jgi:tRNA G18 (ribose-2'-O)-methylase SpoU
LFRLPVAHELSATQTTTQRHRASDLSASLQLIRDRDLRIIATSSHHSTPAHQIDLRGPICLLIGNEGAGVPRELLKQADDVVAIPHSPKVESLNAGVATSILLYEIARQRALARSTD